jgi:hypothetical protein
VRPYARPSPDPGTAEYNVGLCAWDLATEQRRRVMNWPRFALAAEAVVDAAGVPCRKQAFYGFGNALTLVWVPEPDFTAQLVHDVLAVVVDGEIGA